VNEAIRPMVTFALFAFNQEKYIREAINAALSQTYSPLEIILSDDCSSDKTFSIMQEAVVKYKGPHRIIVNRNNSNQGIGGHINTIMEMTRGELIVIAAGDDISANYRVECLVKKWAEQKFKPDLIYSKYFEMSETGLVGAMKNGGDEEKLQAAFMARHGCNPLGATTAWTRRLWTRFGEIRQDVMNEDVVLSMRAVMAGGICSSDESLVKYRIGSGISTTRFSGKERLARIRAKNTLIAKCNLLTAKSALEDIEKSERNDLMALVKVRMMEKEILYSINCASIPNIEFISRAVIAGASFKQIFRASIKHFLPKLHEFIDFFRAIKHKNLSEK
jgi:glycosyltransferase involved in cell wall biosynthesis